MMRYSITFMAMAAIASGQFVTAPRDLIKKTGYAGINIRYKEVPSGICELDPSVKSYSGYADVDIDQHLFFWFFEARNIDPKTAPLTVWINGGPGSSSMIGLFQEIGPCRIDKDLKVVNNPHAWNNVSNMIFIDQPVTTGFSYSIPVNAYETSASDIVTLPGDACPAYAQDTETCGTYSYSNASLTANTTAGAAPNMWKAIQGFMGAFPQYSRNGFHFATESYGGHYGPVFAEYFEAQNGKNINGAHKVSLKSVSIGNGWFDPLIQYQAYYNFTVSPGNTYDYSPFGKKHQHEMYNALYGKGNCYDQIKYCYEVGIDDVCSAADNFCANEVEFLLDTYAKRDEYDIRELDPDPFPESFYATYLNTAHVQKAIGAYTNFSDSSTTVGLTYAATGDDGREAMTIESIRKLLAQDVTVMLFVGDADYICNWLGVEVVSNEVGAKGFRSAGYTNLKTSDHIVHGQVKQAGKFSFVRIYESGHEVPYYQPVAAIEIFARAIAGKDIATGTKIATPGYKSVGTPNSSFREGNGTVQFKVTDKCETYNTTTNEPQKTSACKGNKERRGLSSRRSKRSRLSSRGGKRMGWRSQWY